MKTSLFRFPRRVLAFLTRHEPFWTFLLLASFLLIVGAGVAPEWDQGALIPNFPSLTLPTDSSFSLPVLR